MKRTFAAVLFSLLTVTAPARAAIIDLPNVTAEVITAGGDFVGTPTLTSQSITEFDGVGIASVTSGAPSVGVSATGAQAAFATENYYFAVIGPTNPSVPTFVSGVVFATATETGGASASASITDANNQTNLNEQALDAPINPQLYQASHFYRVPLFLASNSPYEVSLLAAAGGADPAEQRGAHAQADADPYVQIDPSFLAANPGYSLEFSAGIDNVPISAAPLPAALPLFGSGVIAMAGLAWRKRRGEVS
jgi:hypothetical protein